MPPDDGERDRRQGVAEVEPPLGDRPRDDVDGVVPEELVEATLDVRGVDARGFSGAHGRHSGTSIEAAAHHRVPHFPSDAEPRSPPGPPCHRRRDRRRGTRRAHRRGAVVRRRILDRFGWRRRDRRKPGGHASPPAGPRRWRRGAGIPRGRVDHRHLRRARPQGVPAPLPERPVHRRRCVHRHGPARAARRAGHAAQRRGQAHRPDRVEPPRRLLAEQPGAHLRPRTRPPRDVAQRRRPHRRPRPLPEQRRPDRAPRRHHGPAPPVLVGARPARRHHRRQPPADPAARHPADRGPPLHRGHAPAAQGRRDPHRGDPAVPAYRDGTHAPFDAPDDFEARKPHVERLFTELEAAGVPPRRPLPHVGLHRGQHPQPLRARAAPARRDVRRARRHGPRGPPDRRPGPGLHDHRPSRTGPRARRCAASRAPSPCRTTSRRRWRSRPTSRSRSATSARWSKTSSTSSRPRRWTPSTR